MPNNIEVTKNANKNWKNDHLQFARLLAEAVATGAITITDELMETMDLNQNQINEILDRAQNAWDKVKSKT